MVGYVCSNFKASTVFFGSGPAALGWHVDGLLAEKVRVQGLGVG